MNVTDEMVESALDHFYNYSPFNGPDELKAGMRRCIEAALSHAAGQEVVEALIEEVQAFADAYPTDVFGQVTDEEREQHGSLITRASASMGRHIGRRFLPKVLALRAALCPAPGVDGLRQGNWHHPDGGRIVGWVIEPDDVERMGADSFCLPREVAEALANLRDRNTAVARSEGEDKHEVVALVDKLIDAVWSEANEAHRGTYAEFVASGHEAERVKRELLHRISSPGMSGDKA